MSSEHLSPHGRPRAVTRTDVARHAGVSIAVVSFVVNGGPKTVSEATKQRVLDDLGRSLPAIAPA